MQTRTLVGRLLRADQTPLAGVELTLTPRLPRQGYPYTADDLLVVPRKITTTTAADGRFTFANLTTTDSGSLTGWTYELSYPDPEGYVPASMDVTLPSGTGSADLTDVMVTKVDGAGVLTQLVTTLPIMASGKGSVYMSGVSATDLTVQLPPGRFSTPPTVVVTPRPSTPPGMAPGSTVMVYSETTTSFNIRVQLTGTSTGTFTYAWIATTA